MQTQISRLSGRAYAKVAKPILFKQKPDSVHEHLLRSSGRLQKVGVVRYLLTRLWAYQNDKYLAQEVCGIQFRNPVGLSAGFDKNFELPVLIKSIGFGFTEGGSLTYKQCDGNSKPWFYRLPKSKSLVVHAGLANQGVVKIVDRIQSYPRSLFADFPMNISVAKTNSKDAATEAEGIDDYIGSLKHIKAAKVGDVITINISCPNTYGGEPFTTPDKLERLLEKIDKLRLGQPVFIKMPADLPWSEFDKLLVVADKHKVSGVTICNLVKNRASTKLQDSLPDTVKGNLSGKPAWDLSNNLIRKTYNKYDTRFVIIGVGGIFSAEDAYTKIKLGATLVELITGMIFEGPQLIGQINQGLVSLLQKDGFDNIQQAVGTASKNAR